MMPSTPATTAPIVYPDSDGMPVADDTKQFRAIVTIQGNLEALFRERSDVFVAGDATAGGEVQRAAPSAPYRK